ncbi:MAG: NAD(P)/FAD-dependent oxidoreductase [Bacillota bacterium]|nr:NAD(P)/FAD-dependent oxidoreductase [Bacillota bacterium]
MKKLIIIGAGISGLSAGIFARQHGFDAEIYEMHSIPGGECTGWSRTGYHFDNCIHWLTGTKEDTDLYKVWKELGAFQDTDIYQADYLFAYNKNGKTLYFYRDIDKLKQHLNELSPEDNEEIARFIDLIRKFQVLTVPTKKPMDMMNIIDYIKMGMEYRHISKDLSLLQKSSIEEYASRFKSQLIREAIKNTCPENYYAMAIFFSFGTFTSGNGGYPMGGSLKMSFRMADKFKELGGKIFYNTKAKRIIVENGDAVGIQLDSGEIIKGDYVISTVDAGMLMTKLLEGKYKDKVFDKQFNNPDLYPIHSSVNIGFGVSCDLSPREHDISYEVEPFKCGGKLIDRINLKHYCHEPSFAPKGSSVIIVRIMGDDYDYWKNLRDSSTEKYYAEKDKLSKDLIDRIGKLYPETRGKFEAVDVSTPLTYERYFGAYKGAWMGFDISPKSKALIHNGLIKGIDNLFVAGQWIFMPGGLPSAVLAGKWAIQKLCKKEGKEFTFKF